MTQGPLRDATMSRAVQKRFGEAAKIGRIIRFPMWDEASYITGTDLLADGGYIASARGDPAPG